MGKYLIETTKGGNLHYVVTETGEHIYERSRDIIEVVRCKDCKHWHREIHNGIEYFNYNSCDLNHGGDGHDFYCADGEEVK